MNQDKEIEQPDVKSKQPDNKNEQFNDKKMQPDAEGEQQHDSQQPDNTTDRQSNDKTELPGDDRFDEEDMSYWMKLAEDWEDQKDPHNLAKHGDTHRDVGPSFWSIKK